MVCVDGFYEWRREAGRRVPFSFQLKGSEPFVFAGLWENWQDPASGDWLHSCMILTTDANPVVAEVHGRMPVILPEACHRAWLGEEDTADLKAMLSLLDSKTITAWMRRDDDRTCVPVLIRAPENGTKELLAVADGFRESKASWGDLLRELKSRPDPTAQPGHR